MNEGNGQNEANWHYAPEDASQTGAPNQPQNQTSGPVNWTASEFIAHHKDASWYAVVILGTLVLCVAVYFMWHDLMSVIAISIAVLLFIILSTNKPRQQAYSVSDQGVTIGQKFYPYSTFKSFALAHEGAIGSVSFEPLKRFMPEITIYFAPDDEESIISVLAQNLPNDQRREQGFDRIMRNIRF